MKESKRKIAFKVLVGYVILGILAVISGILLFSEIKNYIEIQKQGVFDRNSIIQTGGLIADIYENENLGRAAIQLNSHKRYSEYVLENKSLLKKIDSLNFIVSDVSKKSILDSVKLVLNKKRKNITSLRRLNQRNVSAKSINEAINKLGSIDSILAKESIKEIVDNTEVFNGKTGLRLEEYLKFLDAKQEEKPVSFTEQEQIDSLVSVSKKILQRVQRETSVKKRFLYINERELIKNDITISRKLREVLNILERDVISNANDAYKKHEETLNRSKNIILLATGIGFVIIVLFSIITLNDFWKSQHYRQKLENANARTFSLLKSREQLISMVSHDLRTPLSTITGFSELLQKTIDTAKRKNYTTHIQNASLYMKQLVEDLLEFSMLENGKVTIDRVPFDLEQSIKEVSNSAKRLVKNKPIAIHVNHDSKINSLVVSDPFRIKQILYNLVTNACKFTKEGHIIIKSELKENDVKITVSDTGIGINEDKQEKIFKEFSQVHEKENGQNGFGLGLTISKRLVELLGGSLTLKSQIGKGSEFTALIPVIFSPKTVKENDFEFKGNSSNIYAIVVEDDASIRLFLNDVLEGLGIKVISFDNAYDALKNTNYIPYNLVLTDIQLPKMNGIHFMETLKKHSSYKNQPIIAMTGRTNLSVEEYVKNGFSDALIKPFHTDKLKSILQRYFNLEFDNKEDTMSVNNQPKSFDIDALKTFLNNDQLMTEKILKQFVNDTEYNLLILKNCVYENDLQRFRKISHKMLGMFKQLNIYGLVVFLESFEKCNKVDEKAWHKFKERTSSLLVEIKNDLN